MALQVTVKLILQVICIYLIINKYSLFVRSFLGTTLSFLFVYTGTMNQYFQTNQITVNINIDTDISCSDKTEDKIMKESSC